MPTRRSFLLTSAAATAALPLAAQTSSHAPTPTLPAPIAALKNRSHEAVPITLAERQRRVDRARELMARQKIAALCITGGTSLGYFTGIRSGVSERIFAWILPASGAPYIVCPAFEEARMTEQLSQLPEGAQTRIYTWNEDEDPYALLVKHLPHPGPLALDERVPFVYADRLAQADPSRKVVSGIPITAGCRSIKSPAELAIMQLANNITLSCYKAAFESATPGLTTAGFTALVDSAFAQCGVRGDVSCQTGEWSALPHGSIKPQVIRENQIVLIDDGCVLEGYVSDISRTFVFGKATDRQKKIFDIVHTAQAAALSAARVGAPCHVVDDAARKVVTDAGFGPDYKTFLHRLGHGIGMDGHEWPYLVRGNNQPLEVGMCFSDEPGIYLPGEFGVRLEDDWHLTESGGVMFTPTSSSLENPFA
ncbi:M24 family metallopeptidase [Granulicella sibirica]|uniref:Proline dipeptidase n=1 Tax=Granulicella sibirica TaxID=2479048 RepID=A0A4V1L5T0_9BACT|nr:Xaa-Pro peptidase family protein [Granulicella sibirica]RXH56834.1 Proline dipeptidase [Granulicella sibirica]